MTITEFGSRTEFASKTKPPLAQPSRFSEVDMKIDELFKKLNENKSKL
jgi:hypothetical protein